MEVIKKLNDSVSSLSATLDELLASNDLATVSKLDAKIGATLHSIQYGTGVCAIEIKKAVEAHRRDVRFGVFQPSAQATEEAPKQENAAPENKKSAKRGRKKKK